MIKYIQIFGLQCSGTNVLQNLCNINFDVSLGNRYGGKHGKNLRFARDKDFSDTLFLYIQKNIWAWVCSMKDTTHGVMKLGLPISRAMKEPWADGDFKFDNIIEMRNYVLGMFRNFENIVPNWVNINHDMMVFNPQVVLQNITNRYDILSYDAPINVEIAKRYKGDMKCGPFNRKQYYRTKAYMDRLSKSDIEFIRDNYDMSFEKCNWLKMFDDYSPYDENGEFNDSGT